MKKKLSGVHFFSNLTEALTKAFMTKGKTLEAAQAHIEELKEEERYVLEVRFCIFQRE